MMASRHLACLGGALAVTRTGAFAAMPRRHDVEALLRTPPSHPSDARESPAP